MRLCVSCHHVGRQVTYFDITQFSFFAHEIVAKSDVSYTTSVAFVTNDAHSGYVLLTQSSK